jgi:hypothetical protein
LAWADLTAIILRDSGVAAAGQTPSAQMQQDTKTRLVNMLNMWKRRRWLSYHLVDLSVVCDGSLSYSFGSGGDFNYPRTDQIDYAFARQITPSAQPNQPDFPLRIITSREEYSTITLKEMQAGPAAALFYDSGYPMGEVFPWPLMTNQYELHLGVKSDLDVPTNLTDDIVLPPEYNDAIYYDMLRRTRMAYRLPADSEINKQARASVATIKAANFQIAPLSMPRAIQNYAGPSYNIFSDSWGPSSR